MKSDIETATVQLMDLYLFPMRVVDSDPGPHEVSDPNAPPSDKTLGRKLDEAYGAVPEGEHRVVVSSHRRFGSRDFDTDWASSVLPFVRECANHRARPAPLRFEWTGEADEWLDVIGAGPAPDSMVRLRLRPGVAGPEIVRLEVCVSEHGHIGTVLLRRLELGDLIDLLDRALQFERFLWRLGGGRWHQPVHRPGRAGRPDTYYADWARRYVDALQTSPRRPIQHLIDEERKAMKHVTTAQVKAIINKARRRGLLSDAPPGKSGGELTPAALQALEA